MPVGTKQQNRRIEMKKLLVVLLSLGLIVAFAAAASADTTNVKFQGTFYVSGVYDNNPTLTKDNGYSRAVFHNRLRLQPVFQIADGLSFTARFDALEKNWGDINYKGASGFTDGDQTSGFAAGIATTNTAKVQESIQWERAYVTFATALGVFDVGYQNADGWGTEFVDAAVTRPRIQWMSAMGPLTLGFVYEKWVEDDHNVLLTPSIDTLTDGDFDTYSMFGVYKFTGGEAGLLYKLYYNDTQRAVTTAGAGTTATGPFKSRFSVLAPYMKGTFGPVYVEAEGEYFFGKYKQWENPIAGTATGADVDAAGYAFYLKGQFNMGPANFGAMFGYLAGNDPNDATKEREAYFNKNTTWQPLIIIGGSDRNDWLGGSTALGGGNGANTLQSKTNKMTNLAVGTIYAGYNPTPKLALKATAGYAYAPNKPGATGKEFVSDRYGTEFDLQATYKLYDNLSYYVGAGYLWTGDYWKGSNVNAQVDNDYVVVNKLELAF